MNQHNHEWDGDEWCWVWDENRCCFRWVRRRHSCKRERQHVHEFLGSTRFTEEGEEAHNHRFSGVSGPAIPTGSSHVHRIVTLTDNTDHFHRIEDTTGEAIPVGEGRHVHFVRGETSFDDGHRHEFIFATLIENPTGEDG